MISDKQDTDILRIAINIKVFRTLECIYMVFDMFWKTVNIISYILSLLKNF